MRVRNRRRLRCGLSGSSTGSLDYRRRAPFPFNGTIHRMHVAYLP
jgi:hypothetical protein